MFTLKRFLKDESGATAIEYGLIAALVSIAAMAALNMLGGTLDGKFRQINGALNGSLNNTTLPTP